MLSCRASWLFGWQVLVAEAVVDDVACALQKALGKPTIRDNYVDFFYGEPRKEHFVNSVQFDETSHSITQGQPYGGVSSVDGYNYKLDVRAGRHGSEEVARDFNAGITGDNALGLLASDSLPEELNFAVFGTLSVTIGNITRDCQEIRLAQGHKATQNNWWLAGTQCVLDGTDLHCGCGDSHPNVHFHPTLAPPYCESCFVVSFDPSW